MLYFKIFLLVVGIIWIIVYLLHYHYYVDRETKEKGGFWFAFIFFIFWPYVVVKAVIKTREQKRS